MLTKKEISRFQKKIWSYYRRNKRDLPWRHTADPYKIFVSEVMLQQTQVCRVIGKYESFLKEFPDVFSLAKSDLANVLSAWSGLGYNRRARYLWESAKIITDTYKGKIPKDSKLLDALPGVGNATAASIIVFSYNIPLVFIETNIRRVYIAQGRALALDKGPALIHDKDLLPLIEQTLDRADPRQWYFALMDYGAFLGKTKENPNKKSAHYTKQPQFVGSKRQLRGKIVKLLITHKAVSKEKLLQQLGKTSHDTGKILQALKQEKLIKVKNNAVQLFNG